MEEEDDERRRLACASGAAPLPTGRPSPTPFNPFRSDEDEENYSPINEDDQYSPVITSDDFGDYSVSPSRDYSVSPFASDYDSVSPSASALDRLFDYGSNHSPMRTEDLCRMVGLKAGLLEKIEDQTEDLCKMVGIEAGIPEEIVDLIIPNGSWSAAPVDVQVQESAAGGGPNPSVVSPSSKCSRCGVVYGAVV